jgi:hypothetical protein
MINTTTITKAFINSHHGWAVADQFESTFEQSESFERQNYNALLYIREAVRDLIDSDVLSDNACDELESYYEDLTNYLAEEKE